MHLLVGVLAVASLCLAEPEADPYYGVYSPYHAYPYHHGYYPYHGYHGASGYASALPGHSYQSVHRLHKREADADAEADPQLLLPASTAHLAPVPIFAPAPLLHTAAAPLLHHAAPLLTAEPLVAPALLHHAPAPLVLPAASAAFHVPVVKSVVETPAEVISEVHTPIIHHVPVPVLHHHAPVVHHAPIVHEVHAHGHPLSSGYVTDQLHPTGHSYQAVHRVHKREAEPQFLLPAATPLAAPPLAATPLAAPPLAHAILPTAGAVHHHTAVKSVVEIPAEVQTVHTPLVHPLPFFHHAAPVVHHAAPVVHHAAPVVHHEPLQPLTSIPVALGPHDCVTPGGCALKAALLTGLPSATVGHTTVHGRRKREAEADPLAEADAFYFYSGGLHGAYGFAPYYNPYASFYRHPAPGYYGPYAPAAYHHHAYSLPTAHLAAPATPAVVEEVPAQVVHTAPAVVSPATPLVETVHKKVTYTHIGAHPILPTTVIETEQRLVQ